MTKATRSGRKAPLWQYQATPTVPTLGLPKLRRIWGAVHPCPGQPEGVARCFGWRRLQSACCCCCSAMVAGDKSRRNRRTGDPPTMPSNNLPDPDMVPDMSLPERRVKPPSSLDQPEVSSSYQAEADSPTIAPSKPGAFPKWEEGVREMARWPRTKVSAALGVGLLAVVATACLVGRSLPLSVCYPIVGLSCFVGFVLALLGLCRPTGPSDMWTVERLASGGLMIYVVFA